MNSDALNRILLSFRNRNYAYPHFDKVQHTPPVSKLGARKGGNGVKRGNAPLAFQEGKRGEGAGAMFPLSLPFAPAAAFRNPAKSLKSRPREVCAKNQRRSAYAGRVSRPTQRRSDPYPYVVGKLKKEKGAFRVFRKQKS